VGGRSARQGTAARSLDFQKIWLPFQVLSKWGIEVKDYPVGGRNDRQGTATWSLDFQKIWLLSQVV
jgi:hypothetical protein